MARHRRGCQGGDRLPTCWDPHSPSVDMAPQASCEQMEGCACVAPSVPNHREHSLTEETLGKFRGAKNKGVREFLPNTSAFRPFPAHRTEGQRAELWEGRGRGAVPTPLRFYDALVTPGSSGLQAVSAVPPPGNDAKTARGQGHLSASRAQIGRAHV